MSALPIIPTLRREWATRGALDARGIAREVVGTIVALDDDRDGIERLASAPFEVIDAPSPFSGEWAGESLSELGLRDLDGDDLETLEEAYLEAYSRTIRTEAAAILRDLDALRTPSLDTIAEHCSSIVERLEEVQNDLRSVRIPGSARVDLDTIEHDLETLLDMLQRAVDSTPTLPPGRDLRCTSCDARGVDLSHSCPVEEVDATPAHGIEWLDPSTLETLASIYDRLNGALGDLHGVTIPSHVRATLDDARLDLDLLVDGFEHDLLVDWLDLVDGFEHSSNIERPSSPARTDDLEVVRAALERRPLYYGVVVRDRITPMTTRKAARDLANQWREDHGLRPLLVAFVDLLD